MVIGSRGRTCHENNSISQYILYRPLERIASTTCGGNMYEKYERLRDAQNLSDYQVAAKSGVSRSTISEWKTGKHTPNLENMKKLADFFKVRIEELLE